MLILRNSIIRFALSLSCLICTNAGLSQTSPTNYIRIKSFGFADQAGATPSGALLQASDGFLYGTARIGGAGGGVLFKMKCDGTGCTALRCFGTSGSEGREPCGAPLEFRDSLYGVTCYGGNANAGTIFRIGKDGSGYVVLHYFQTNNLDARYPGWPLLGASDGMLYGVTSSGGSNACGAVFKLAPDGTGYQILHHFSASASDGRVPAGPLIESQDGFLYGTTQSGGSNNFGTVFRLGKDGQQFRVLYAFAGGTRGSSPQAALTDGSNGMLFGTTSAGGDRGGGIVFTLNHDGTGFAVLRSFQGPPLDGNCPQAQLVEGTNAYLYGTTQSGGSNNAGVVFKLSPSGQDYAVLHHFLTDRVDGANPAGSVIQARDGAHYGTTMLGGKANRGAAFKLNPDGSNYTILRSFSMSSGDGADPAALTLGRDGVFYGVCNWGGIYDAGIIFRLNPFATGYDILRNFTGLDADGLYPSTLVQGSDGKLYGSTHNGGVNNAGLLFRLATDGTGYTILHQFQTNGIDGVNPSCFVAAGNGVLYGCTLQGGRNGNAGTLFSVGEDGGHYTVLRSFDFGGTNGWWPYSLIQGSDSVLYGTTWNVGLDGGGTVFKINTNGTAFTVLHRFTPNFSEGCNPRVLLEGTGGALYGATMYGGTNNVGVVFAMDKAGQNFTVLHRFLTNNLDGRLPGVTLCEMADGTLLGATLQGGSANAGTVFRLEKDGSHYEIVRDCASLPQTGTGPFWLTAGPGGAFYALAGGGDLGSGIVFSLSPVASSWFVSTSRGADRMLSLAALGTAGVTFQLQAIGSLSNTGWSAVETRTATQTGALSFTNLSTEPQLFYRLLAE